MFLESSWQLDLRVHACAGLHGLRACIGKIQPHNLVENESPAGLFEFGPGWTPAADPGTLAAAAAGPE